MSTAEQIKTLENRISELEKENRLLLETVHHLTRKLYGRSTEKTSVLSLGQMSLFNEAETETDPKSKEPDLKKVEGYRRKKVNGRREELLENLPHEKKLCTLVEDERFCETCNTPLKSVGEKFVRTEVEYIPAKLRVIDLYRETFECRSCRKNGLPYMEKSPIPDSVIQHSLATPSTVAWVMHQKFVNALPLYRQEKEWKTLGLSLSRATMANWIIAASRDWLTPILKVMHQELLKEKYIHADETPVQVMNEEGRKNTSDSYMWVYTTGKHTEHPIRIFEYEPGRNGIYPQKFLEGFKGYLHSDAYAGYKKVENIIRCLCWSHLRRNFVDALPKDIRGPDDTLSGQGITYCNKLFEIESTLENLTSEKRKFERLKQEKPVLDAFWAWIDSVENKVLPKSKLSKALNYALNQKQELMNYLEDGNCCISNNLAENCIRPFTIGRKNWLFSGSPRGAAASAAVYSMIESAEANGLSPYKYLYYILNRLPGEQFGQYPEILEDYLPWSPEVQEICK
ncbi:MULTISPECIES: IS66 family transposase [unclassified Dehalobacter]|uniref:IS66 family transposase n=1 Tax=unclassified Dehalobacter TaxID=2635733 RepID=UPI00258CA812|nr:IS66 family transposase [Dehalobacter sp.]MCM1566833.1 IS66 family transposase [Dehalobacter sp.]MDJ0306916.1 IS66 family transposase [Dehalobacter sp.]